MISNDDGIIILQLVKASENRRIRSLVKLGRGVTKDENVAASTG